MKQSIKRIMKDMHLPSGQTCGLPLVVADDWSALQAVAVAQLLEDLLHVIHSRYQGEIYAHWKTTRIFGVEGSDDDEDVPF